MRVHVKVFAGLRNFAPEGKSPFDLDLEPGATVGDLLERLGIPQEKPKILLVNGRHASLDRELSEGDEVSLFPPVAGG